MATNAQGRHDRTLAVAAPTHSIRTPVRSTVLRVACWAVGIVLWLVLAYAAGAEPMMGAAPSASASRFFNRDTGAHFYSTDAVERQRILVFLA